MKEEECQTPLSQLEKSAQLVLKAVKEWHKAVGQKTPIKVLDLTKNWPGNLAKKQSRLGRFKIYYERIPVETPADQAKFEGLL